MPLIVHDCAHLTAIRKIGERFILTGWLPKKKEGRSLVRIANFLAFLECLLEVRDVDETFPILASR